MVQALQATTSSAQQGEATVFLDEVCDFAVFSPTMYVDVCFQVFFQASFLSLDFFLKFSGLLPFCRMLLNISPTKVFIDLRCILLFVH